MGKGAWTTLPLSLMELFKSVNILKIRSSEFGPVVAICPMYVEANFALKGKGELLIFNSTENLEQLKRKAKTEVKSSLVEHPAPKSWIQSNWPAK